MLIRFAVAVVLWVCPIALLAVMSFPQCAGAFRPLQCYQHAFAALQVDMKAQADQLTVALARIK